jgi:hypothetical protein
MRAILIAASYPPPVMDFDLGSAQMLARSSEQIELPLNERAFKQN